MLARDGGYVALKWAAEDRQGCQKPALQQTTDDDDKHPGQNCTVSVHQCYGCSMVAYVSQSTELMSGLFGGHKSSKIKSDVSPCSSLTVLRAQCADELTC